ncbi:unnamed protein product [Victoria cruziana]
MVLPIGCVFEAMAFLFWLKKLIESVRHGTFIWKAISSDVNECLSLPLPEVVIEELAGMKRIWQHIHFQNLYSIRLH